VHYTAISTLPKTEIPAILPRVNVSLYAREIPPNEPAVVNGTAEISLGNSSVLVQTKEVNHKNITRGKR
jgi:hypothetical protein